MLKESFYALSYVLYLTICFWLFGFYGIFGILGFAAAIDIYRSFSDEKKEQ